jgi:Yip1 domain
MNLIERVKNILVTPKTEWEVINGEAATPMSLLTSYVVPMALIGAVAGFIGYGFVGLNILGIKIGGISWGLAFAAKAFLSAITSYFICTYVIDALAPSFASEKDINKSAQLVAYSFTAGWVASIFSIIPSLGILSILGLYSVYLFYTGLTPMKKTFEDKKIVYMIVSALVIIVCSIVVNMIMDKVIYAILGNPFAAGFENIFKR